MTEQIDAQKAFSGTVAPTGTDVLDAGKLAEWMTANVAGFEGPVEVLKFAGGQSNPTYRLNAKSGSYVLRRKPFGQLLPSAHAVDREYKVIAGLYPTGFPVAKPYGLCTDDSVSRVDVLHHGHGRGPDDLGRRDAGIKLHRTSRDL